MVCDKAIAMYTAFSIEAALHEQLRSRKGQIISLNPLKVASHWGSSDVHFGVDCSTWTPKTLAKPGAVKALINLKPIYSVIPFKDGEPGYMVSVSDKEWKGFCDAFADTIAKSPHAHKVQTVWKTLAGRLIDPTALPEITEVVESVALASRNPPLATDNLLENTDGGTPSVFSRGRQPAAVYFC